MVYEVFEDGYVKEFIKFIGGSWGGIKVDEEYMDFFKCFIGDDMIKYIDENFFNLLFEVRRDFESVKYIIKLNFDKKINVRFFVKIVEIYMILYFDKDLRVKDIVLIKNKKQMVVLFKGDKL